MPAKTYRVQVPVMLDLEVLSALEPAAIEDGIKRRFAGGSDPLCGTQVFFSGDHAVGHMMARTRNVTFIPDSDVKIALDEVTSRSS